MTHEEDERYMRLALDVATKDGADPSLSPIGSVIVRDGEVLAVEKNCVEACFDPTAHAEITAIRAAGRKLESSELRHATLYSTLQPCGMCTMASIWAKVGRVVYGAGREDVHRMYFEARHVDTLEFIEKAYRDDLSVRGGVLRETCAALYYGPDDHPPREEQGNI